MNSTVVTGDTRLPLRCLIAFPQNTDGLFIGRKADSGERLIPQVTHIDTGLQQGGFQRGHGDQVA
jgi:hypothetical protein